MNGVVARNCSRCGHSMGDSTGRSEVTNVIALDASIVNDLNLPHSEITRFQETYGTSGFLICWCCAAEICGVPKK